MHVSSHISLSPYLLISLSHYLLISLSPYLLISLSHYLLISLSPYLLISLSPYLLVQGRSSGGSRLREGPGKGRLRPQLVQLPLLYTKPVFLTFNRISTALNGILTVIQVQHPDGKGLPKSPRRRRGPHPLPPYLLISSLPPRQFMHPTTANKRRPGATIEWIADRIASGSSRDPSIHPSPPACIPEAFRKFRVPRSNG